MNPDPAQELIAKIKILHDTVWEGHASQPAIDQWLSNFSEGSDADRKRLHALHLLSQFMYFGSRQMRALLRAMFRDLYRYPIIEGIRKANGDTTETTLIHGQFQKELEKTRFLGIGNPSESGSHLLYYYRQENVLPKHLFIHTHQVTYRRGDKIALRNPSVTRLVFIDDFCGSGSQGLEYSEDILKQLKDIEPNLKVIYHVLFATSRGMEVLRTQTLFDSVECLFELDASFTCFGTDSRYFSQQNERIDKTFAEDFCRRYGQMILSGAPLGFGDCQLLLGFHHNTPDNTLPIFWFENPDTSTWVPIFRRYPKVYGWASP